MIRDLTGDLVGGRLPDFQRDVHCLLGLPIDAVDMAGAVDLVRRHGREKRPCFLSTPNLNFLMGSLGDPDFRDSVVMSDLSIADGMPLVWVARLLGIPLAERVTGSGLVEKLRQGDGGAPLKIYFFGGPDGVAAAASEVLNREKRGLVCVGFHSPGFGSISDMSTPAIIADINRSGADFLIVALGARKGQAWIQHNRARLAVPVVSHLGAVVNFVAGRVSRAPRWMQKSGLEWLWRIKEEPALWRRYGDDGLAFVRVLATRVLPHCWYQWRHRPREEKPAHGLEMSVRSRRAVIRLTGAWVRGNLQALRDCLARELPAGRDLRLDLGQVSYGDSAFLGLLLLLHGHLQRQGRRLELAPVSPALERIVKYAGAHYLLAQGEHP